MSDLEAPMVLRTPSLRLPSCTSFENTDMMAMAASRAAIAPTENRATLTLPSDILAAWYIGSDADEDSAFDPP